MSVLLALLVFASSIALLVFLILAIIKFIKKDSKAGIKHLIFTGASFVGMIFFSIIFIFTIDTSDIAVEDESEMIETVADVEENNTPVEETPKEKATSEAKEAEEKGLAEQDSKEEAEAKVKAEEEKKIPREYKAALQKAKQYAEIMHMSKEGIYDQLVSEYGEGFPPEAARYAVDNLEWDYKENALKKAQSYAEMMSMSDSAIYDQLISEHGEKFTPEEAQYAIDNLE